MARCDCGKEASLDVVRDFRGNGIAVVCAECTGELHKLLDKVFRHYGGIPGKCSCWHSPSICSVEQLKAEVAGYK
jgi:hypothetical protein